MFPETFVVLIEPWNSRELVGQRPFVMATATEQPPIPHKQGRRENVDARFTSVGNARILSPPGLTSEALWPSPREALVGYSRRTARKKGGYAAALLSGHLASLSTRLSDPRYRSDQSRIDQRDR